jgi:phosphoesterase RecJ-like protein
LKNIARVLMNEDNFLVATHLNPDGDAIGSTIALAMGLEALGKKATVFDKDGVPQTLRFLPGTDRVTDSVGDTKDLMLVLLDCNSLKRAGLQRYTFRRSLVIDHHETETDFGDIRWIAIDEPAVGLMVFNLLKEMGVEITPDIAENLYAAIAVDTGTFRYPNTSAAALKAAAELTEAGARPGDIAERLYRSMGTNRFALLSMTLDGLEIDGDVGITAVSIEMFQKTGAKAEDTENFVNYPLVMEQIKVSILLREVEDGWKASLRSKGERNVAQIASMFEGGGHQNAAGCILKADLKTAKRMLLEALKETLT